MTAGRSRVERGALLLVAALVYAVLVVAMFGMLALADKIRDGLSWWVVGGAVVLVALDEIRAWRRRRRSRG